MTDDTMPLLDALPKRGGGDSMKELAEEVLGRLMAYDVEGRIGAGRHERDEERTTRRNKYRQSLVPATARDGAARVEGAPAPRRRWQDPVVRDVATAAHVGGVLAGARDGDPFLLDLALARLVEALSPALQRQPEGPRRRSPPSVLPRWRARIARRGGGAVSWQLPLRRAARSPRPVGPAPRCPGSARMAGEG